MHYFEFNIKSYKAETSHLTDDEDLAYRRLLDLYYDTEKPIANDPQFVSRKIRMSGKAEIVKSILSEFFSLGDDGCWHQDKCDENINKFQSFTENGKKGAKIRWRNNRGAIDGHMAKDSPPINSPIPTNNHKPITNNQIYKNTATKSDDLNQKGEGHAKRKPRSWADAASDCIEQYANQEHESLDTRTENPTVDSPGPALLHAKNIRENTGRS